MDLLSGDSLMSGSLQSQAEKVVWHAAKRAHELIASEQGSEPSTGYIRMEHAHPSQAIYPSRHRLRHQQCSTRNRRKLRLLSDHSHSEA